MNAYLSIKYQGEDNEEVVRELVTAAERAGFSVTASVRDFDDFGRQEQPPEQLLPFMTNSIEHADVLLIDGTEKGVGIGFEAGYAAANQIPIVVLTYQQSDISPILELAAFAVISFDGYEQLFQALQQVKRRLQEES